MTCKLHIVFVVLKLSVVFIDVVLTPFETSATPLSAGLIAMSLLDLRSFIARLLSAVKLLLVLLLSVRMSD